MGKHRDRLDIVANILKIAAKSSSKTNIMHEANLSFDLLKKYLEMVVEQGLLQSTNRNFQLTATGKNFLYQYFYLQDQYSKVQGLIDNLNYERRILDTILEPKLFETTLISTSKKRLNNNPRSHKSQNPPAPDCIRQSTT